MNSARAQVREGESTTAVGSSSSNGIAALPQVELPLVRSGRLRQLVVGEAGGDDGLDALH